MSETNNNNDVANNAEENNNGGVSEVEKAKKMMNEIAYCFSSFHAVFTPVSICMILSALAVVFINTEETRAAGEAAFANTYEVVDLDEGNSSQNFLASVANTLIIVSVICVMTFVVVLLYKYRCMKIFLAYMIFVTAILLGYLTSNLWLIAIEKYGWKVDKLSFAYIMYNYAVVGTLAIFWPAGIPKWVSQGYLIGTSVVLAWQLSFFSEWTAWTLLVVLALYDLFAVLTPCGPLKALANLMSRPDAPVLPGLLYEASLPSGVQRPKRNNVADRAQEEQNQTAAAEVPDANTETIDTQRIGYNSSPDGGHINEDKSIANGAEHNENNQQLARENVTNTITQMSSVGEGEVEMIHNESQVVDPVQKSTAVLSDASAERQGESSSRIGDTEVGISSEPVRIGNVPLAIAKMYKLRVIDETGILRPKNQPATSWKRDYSAEDIRAIEWTPKQLRTEVPAVFPNRGGRIERSDETSTSFNEGPQYNVFNRHGTLLRTFVVNREGKVMQVVKRHPEDDSEENNSIKLGLGDFIFYSVLVSKAALYSFTSFAACMVVILFGLMATLVLLAIHGKALPALPISIFLGVVMFFLTRYFTEPWLQEVLRLPFYV